MFDSDRTSGESAPVSYKLIFGGASGVCAQISCYPIDVVRRRIQTSGDSSRLINRYLVTRVHTVQNARFTNHSCILAVFNS